MSRSAKRRRKALSKQLRQSKNQAYAASDGAGRKFIHRFTLLEGVVAGACDLYSDEEAE